MIFTWKIPTYSRRMASAGLLLMVLPTAGITQSTDEASMTMPATNSQLTFTSWVGPYMRSQMLGFVRPYEEQNNTRVNVLSYEGGINEVRDQVESANVTWDVVDFTQADLLRACEEGLLEDLSDIQLPNGADGSNFKDDFFAGALAKCGVGSIVWATAFAYSNSAFGSNPPTTISDFFDVKNYPGPRAIRSDPSVIVEWALMADGVDADDVYGTLETEEGLERAFAMLDNIKPGLQFWTTGRGPIRMLNAEEVTMAMTWATTAAKASAEEGSNLTMVWDGRVIEMDLYGIPKGTRNLEEALDFISFATSSESLAREITYHPAGPARNSSLGLITEDVLLQTPNGPAYADRVFIQSDAVWWSENYDRVKEAFNAWMLEATQKGAAGTTR